MENKNTEELPASQSRTDDGEGIQSTGNSEKKYIVKHNKSDVVLTLDELVKNAEKGLDYDRIRPSHDFVKSLAAKSGETNVSQFIEKMNAQDTGDTPAGYVKQPKANAVGNEMEVIEKEYPEYVKGGSVTLPAEALELHEKGMGLLEACRVADIHNLKKQCESLSAKLDVREANKTNAQAAIGSLAGGGSPEREYYSSQEWDRLPQSTKEKFIRNGKIYDFMKKWSGNK